MRTSLLRRLSIRVRILLVGGFVVGSLLPPYVPDAALSASDDNEDAPTPQFLFVEEGFLMKSSSLGQQGTRLAFSQTLMHTVQQGESLAAIAKRYNIDVKTIQWANNLKSGASVKPGQELTILPVNGVLHTVRTGQTLNRIAQLYDVPATDIARQNSVRGGFIVAGQELIIPGAKPVVNPDTVAVIPPPPSMQRLPLQFNDRLPSTSLRLPDGATVTPSAKPGSNVFKQVPLETTEVTGTLLQMPCANCSFTQYYRAGHYAVDIQTRGGGPVYASENGTVIRAATGWNGGYGNVVEIDHGNGLVTLYAHNKELYVNVGDTVARGQKIAWMGNTGFVYGVTGIHIHFEVRKNGVKKNPLLYLQ